MTYIVFMKSRGEPQRDTLKITKNENTAIGHAMLLCRNNDINLQEAAEFCGWEKQGDLTVDNFKIGIGRHDKTVYIWEVEEE